MFGASVGPGAEQEVRKRMEAKALAARDEDIELVE
jgi:hypothetical protein